MTILKITKGFMGGFAERFQYLIVKLGGAKIFLFRLIIPLRLFYKSGTLLDIFE